MLRPWVEVLERYSGIFKPLERSSPNGCAALCDLDSATRLDIPTRLGQIERNRSVFQQFSHRKPACWGLNKMQVLPYALSQTLHVARPLLPILKNARLFKRNKAALHHVDPGSEGRRLFRDDGALVFAKEIWLCHRPHLAHPFVARTASRPAASMSKVSAAEPSGRRSKRERYFRGSILRQAQDEAATYHITPHGEPVEPCGSILFGAAVTLERR